MYAIMFIIFILACLSVWGVKKIFFNNLLSKKTASKKYVKSSSYFHRKAQDDYPLILAKLLKIKNPYNRGILSLTATFQYDKKLQQYYLHIVVPLINDPSILCCKTYLGGKTILRHKDKSREITKFEEHKLVIALTELGLMS